MKVLALSGSLRAASINSALLRTVARLAPAGIEVTLSSLIRELPLFNPDLESPVPPIVARFHAQVAACDALIIASPEYAHGVSGCIKNALDWLVSFELFVGKPVAVLNASPRAYLADAALRETLRTMSAVVVDAACVSIPLLGANLTEQEMAHAPSVALAIRASLAALGTAARPTVLATTPEQLERYLYDHIPLSQAMSVAVLAAAPDGVMLGAPLAPNINHRHTAFGGSISALAILSAWSLLHLRLTTAGITSRLVIQRHSMTYEQPIVGEFTARSHIGDESAWTAFMRTLSRKGRARIAVSCNVEYQGLVAGRFQGDFVALGAGE